MRRDVSVVKRAHDRARGDCIISPGGTTATISQPETTALSKPADDAYYVICISQSVVDSEPAALEQAAKLIQLSAQEFSLAVTLGQPVPLARAATAEQADVLLDRLRALGIETLIVSARELQVETWPKKIRALELSNDSIVGITISERESVAWEDIIAIVTGRLLEKRSEVEERRRRGRNQPVDSRSLFADDLVLDLYSRNEEAGWRIQASNFDFSCLGSEKKITAVENFAVLTSLLRERAGNAEFDDSYLRMRAVLNPVWPLEEDVKKGGWRRSGAGKFDVSTVTTTGNAAQFTRYSRLHRRLRARDLTGN